MLVLIPPLLTLSFRPGKSFIVFRNLNPTAARPAELEDSYINRVLRDV